ncbi:MAG: DMT family transporter, partial [Bacteroidaceae bacterium]|nr:DMT family transporter [Bacteroidaceae bacterium]
VFSAVWLFAYMGVKGRLNELCGALKTKDGRWCILAAVFGGPLAMTFYTLAISTGGAALAASVTAIYPLLGTALAVMVLKEKTGLQTWLGLIVCVIGIVVIGWSPTGVENVNVSLGVILALVAAIGWATEAVVSGYGMKDGVVDPYMALLIRYLTSAVVYIIVVAPIFGGGFVSAGIGLVAIFSYTPCWFLLALTALVGMISFLCWYTAIDNIGATKGLCLNVTYSFWSVFFALVLSLFLPEFFSGALSWYIAIGALLILSGVSMATLYKAK